jgi:UDP-N-acetylglucosamine--dolichyl-phosphate N-acetylglucosaminephosphotransferase
MYHTYLTILIPSIVSLIITYFATKFVISYFYEAGIIAEDHNKEKPVLLPSSGGIAVAFGLIAGILTYTFGGSFIYTPILDIDKLLATALSIALIVFVGFIDDINVKARRVKATGMQDIKKGLKQWQKPLLTLLGALPLMAINAGVSTIHIPFLGVVDFGIIYPLIIIPLAVIFVSNAFNLLGGFDGLQTGMGVVASLALLIYSLLYGTNTGILLSALLFSSLIIFYPFNMYKAKIIPGDSFTYGVGAALVAIMIMGNAESFGTIIFIPWIIEFFLHLRGRFDTTDVGIRQKDGTFKAPYGKKIYSLTHFVMNLKPMREYEVSAYLVLIEVAFVFLAFGLKFLHLL